MSAPYTLVLLRHGESDWNAKNQFTGWVDVPLSEKGTAEAVRGGALLAERGLLPDVVHTSVLRRAITTANLALDACDRHWVPVRRHWRLNERHYGALQGKNKKQTLERVRRGAVHALAPLLRHPAAAHRRRRRVQPGRRPAVRGPAARADAAHRVPAGRRRAGCCRTGTTRSCRTCATGRTVAVVAHGNSLRALVKHLDGISDDDIAGLNIPTGIPLLYAPGRAAAPDRGRRRVPRPRRGRRRHPGGGQPGPLTRCQGVDELYVVPRPDRSRRRRARRSPGRWSGGRR